MPQKLDLQPFMMEDPTLDLQSFPQSPPSTMDWWIEQSLRTVPAVAGSLIGGATGFFGAGVGAIPGAMGGGALGSGIGNVLGQWYRGDEFNPYEFGVETALGAIPPIFKPVKYAGSGLGALAKYAGKSAISGAGEGAIIGAGATPFQEWAQSGSFIPSWQNVAAGTLGGAAIGGATGGGIGAYQAINAPRVSQPRLPGMESFDPRTINEFPPISYVNPATPPPVSELRTRGHAAIDAQAQQQIFELTMDRAEAQRAGDLATVTQIDNAILEAKMQANDAKRNWAAPTPPPESPAPVFPEMGGEQGGLNFGAVRGEQGRFRQAGEFEYTPITRTGLPAGGPGEWNFPSVESMAPPRGVDVVAPEAPAPSAEAQAASTAQGPESVVITNPGSAEHQQWLNRGYVKGPITNIEGRNYPTVVRPDIAPPSQAAAPPPVGSGAHVGPIQGRIPVKRGEPIRIPTNQVTPQKTANLEMGGYRWVSDDPDGKTTFAKTGVEIEEPVLQADIPSQSPEDIRARLTAMLGREPTAQEIQLVMARQAQPGETTGRVANFPSNAANLYEVTQAISQGTGNPDALMQRAQQIIDNYKTASQARTDYVELSRLTADARTPDEAELFQSIADSIKEKGNQLDAVETAASRPQFINPQTGQPTVPPPVPMRIPETGGLDVAGLRQQNVLGPRAVSPEDVVAPIEFGQQELPWSRGEVAMPIDGDAMMRQRAYEAEQARQAAMPQPRQQELDFEPYSDEPAFARAEPGKGLIKVPPDINALERLKERIYNTTTLEDLAVIKKQYDVVENELKKISTGELSEAEYAHYNKMEELLGEIYDELNARYADLGMGNEPAFARAPGGGLTASVDIRRAVENITRDYTSPLPGIMSREGLQNALDAADKLGTGGDVKIRMDRSTNTIEIYDNGKGLDEDQLAHKLVEIFATGKEGEEGATGGKGIGSASYIYGGQHFKITTISVDSKDGLKYKIVASGTPEQFLDPVKGSDWSKVPVHPKTSTGTTIEVLLKNEHDIDDARAMVENIVNNSRNRSSRIVVDEQGASIGTALEDIVPDGGDIVEHRFASSKNDKMVGDFTTVNRNSEVKVLIPVSNFTIPRSNIEIHYLNNGMYQFSEEMYLGGMAEGVPDRVLVDIHPLVDDQNELYPFINTREDIKKDIRDEVNEFLKKNIAAPGITKRKNRVQELYDSMSPVPIGSAHRNSIIFDPGNRLTPDEMNGLVSNPIIQRLVQTYDTLINNILVATGKQKWINRLEGVGLVFDPNMHGVHIPNPATGKSTILINPFLRIGDPNMTPREAAWRNTHTNLHEVAHVGAESGIPIVLSPQDLADPRLGEFFGEYLNQLVKHGDVGLFTNTGHGMDFAHRLGEVYAKFGVDATFKAADEIHGILTAGGKSGGYSPEIQKLLQIYTESRGRAATTEDLLSGTGVKQTDRGRGAEGSIPGDSQANGNRATPGIGARIKQKTGWGMGEKQKAEHNFITEALAVPSAATTTGDFSPPGRQGLALIHTPQFWKAAYRMFKGLSPESFKRMNEQLETLPIMQESYDPNTGKVKKSFAEENMGITINRPASEVPIGQRAENAASRWLEVGFGDDPLSKIYKHSLGYPIRATNRAFLTFINQLKVNRAQFLVDKAQQMAIKGESGSRIRQGGLPLWQRVTPEQAENLNPYHNLVLAKEIGDFVNTAVGQAPKRIQVLPFRGGELNLEGAAKALNMTMFSPGLFFSRARMLSPATYVMATPQVRKEYLKSALAMGAAWFAFTELAKMAGGKDVSVSNNITNADFGKVRIGDTRLDPGGGFLQFLVLYGRMYQGGYTSSANPEKGFKRFGAGFQAETQLSNAMRFASNKLNPAFKFAYDLADSSQYKPFHMGDRTIQMFVPLIAQDLWEVYKDDPELLGALGRSLPPLFGMGTQTYSKGESVAKFIPTKKDWLVTGGGFNQFIPGQGRMEY